MAQSLAILWESKQKLSVVNVHKRREDYEKGTKNKQDRDHGCT